MSDGNFCSTAAPPGSEVILKVGGEGGAVTIYGCRTAGEWLFSRQTIDHTPTLIDEPAIASQSRIVHSWADALELIERYPWHALVPLEVHPEFRVRVFDEVIKRVRAGGPRTTSQLRRWRDKCGLRDVDVVVAALRKATRVVVLTGAGASAESGLPTFRDKQTGLWENFDAAELATPEAFARDPVLVWGWYEWRRAAVLRARPNPAHQAIAAMAKLIPTFTLVTQNVDDLHERAGSHELLHLHGELARPYCERCREPYMFAAGIPDLPASGSRIEPPQCRACGGRVRPGVVWFGEALPEREWLAAQKAARNCEVFLCVGTSSVVQPAASLTGIAMPGAVTVEVNPNPTELGSEVTCVMRGRAGEVLPEIVRLAWPEALP